MRILLTGATGLIGGKLVFRLLEKQHDLVILARDPVKAEKNLGIPAEFHAWDAERSPPSADALKDLDAVIHLAGEPVAAGRWTAARKKRIYDSRILGTRNLIQALSRIPGRKPPVLISGSAIGIYGNRGEEVLTEQSKIGPGFLADLARDWEKEAAADYGVPAGSMRRIFLRTGIVLSPAGGALAEMLPPFRAGLGGPIGNGNQWMSWIHIEDMVSLILHALESPALSGPVNATAPQPVTNRNFAKALGKALHRPSITPAPAFALRMLFGEMADEALLASARVMPERLLKANFKFKFESLGSALTDLFPAEKQGAVREFIMHQWVPQPVEKIFPFFTDEKNLETLTPGWLNFKVVNKSTPEVQKGTVINYQLKLHGLPLRWQSRIDDWIPNHRFRDTQLHGPYTRWEHTHTFVPVKGGTLLGDRVLYGVPMGSLGQLVAGAYVTRDISRIFEYRRKKISELFNHP